jgi:hypothetical protein
VGPIEDKKASETKEQAIEEQKTGTSSLLDPLWLYLFLPQALESLPPAC